MRDRNCQILRLACLILGALVLSQVLRTIFHVTPFIGVKIPAIPTLATNAPANSTPSPTASPSVAVAHTNSVSEVKTNSPATSSTNATIAKFSATNSLTNSLAVTATNVPPHLANLAATNVALTNVAVTNLAHHLGTNSLGTNHLVAVADGTNAPSATHHHPMPGGPMAMGGMPGMPGAPTDLPPEIKARVDKIVNSEIFAPIMHPMPMALMGIAGNTAFLRTESGQTGLVKEGDSLGDVKLVKIGINRVLVEQGGQQKELTIFDGYGSQSLLSQSDHSSK